MADSSKTTLLITHGPTSDDVIRIPLTPDQAATLRPFVDPLADDDPSCLPLTYLHIFLIEERAKSV